MAGGDIRFLAQKRSVLCVVSGNALRVSFGILHAAPTLVALQLCLAVITICGVRKTEIRHVIRALP